MLQQMSNHLSRLEARAAGFCMLLVTLLILFNVITRAMNKAVFWVDEAAVYLMVWMLFFATAVLIKRRTAVAVTVLVDYLPPAARRLVGVLIDWLVLLFGVLLLVFCWYWFAPVQLVQHGFDVASFSNDTMNFIYQERPNTLPIPKFWVWLIIPFFALSVCIHTLANILADGKGRYMDKKADGEA